jgi:hypothetical protein
MIKLYTAVKSFIDAYREERIAYLKKNNSYWY